jgi:fumarate hydratase class II
LLPFLKRLFSWGFAYVRSLTSDIGFLSPPDSRYDKGAEIAKKAFKENTTLRQAALDLGHLTDAEFTRLVDPTKMIGPTPSL